MRRFRLFHSFTFWRWRTHHAVVSLVFLVYFGVGGANHAVVSFVSRVYFGVGAESMGAENAYTIPPAMV